MVLTLTYSSAAAWRLERPVATRRATACSAGVRPGRARGGLCGRSSPRRCCGSTCPPTGYSGGQGVEYAGNSAMGPRWCPGTFVRETAWPRPEPLSAVNWLRANVCGDGARYTDVEAEPPLLGACSWAAGWSPIGLRPAGGRRALTFSDRTLPSAAGRGVFVGREGELAVLEAAAAAARRGQPKVALVEGEAGIGKSSLLTRFASGLADAMVLRASGDEAELLLPYGIVGQLVASAHGAGGPPRLLAEELSDRVDPLAVGADLVAWLGQFQGMVLAVIDDLQWADGLSARALLFAVRRLHADHVLVVVAARAGELPRLGEGWQRFLAGDHRAGRVRLAGLGAGDVVALGRALGAGELPRRAAGRLLEETGGNPLYCRTVLEEAEAGGLDRPGAALGVPRSLAGVVLLRVGSLSPAARELVAAAAVLGHHCELSAAAALAGLGDPLPALGEAMAAGILIEQPGGGVAGIGFSHLLVQRAVYDDLSPVRRRRLHQRAAGLADRDRALGHRVAASMGPDDGLAAELEAAGQEARRSGPDVAGGGPAGAGGGGQQRACGCRSPPAGRAGDPGHVRRGGRGGGPCRPGGGGRRAGCAAELVAGHAGFPCGPGRRGRGPSAGGVADP